MKIFKILTHPYTVIVSFCFVLISGESFGGFYLMYVLMALVHGGIHSILALLGMGMLLTNHNLYGKKVHYLIYPLLNVIGTLLLYFSFIAFFWNSRGYNNATFEQTLPIITFVLFGMISICFLVRTILSQFSRPFVL